MFGKQLATSIVWTFGIAALFLPGCGGPSDNPPIGEVTGKVTMDGKPVPGVSVVFQPDDGGRSSQATTDDEGMYALIYSSTEAGAKAGKHHVEIAYSNLLGEAPAGPTVKIPPKYNSKTELTADVVGGESNEINFDLKSK